MKVFLVDLRNGSGKHRYTCTEVADIVNLIQRTDDLSFLRVDLVDAVPTKRANQAAVGAAS